LIESSAKCKCNADVIQGGGKGLLSREQVTQCHRPKTPPTALHTSAHQIAFDCKLIAALHADLDADASADVAAEVGGI